jgi:molybdopterin converting factor small subunit
MHITIIFSGLLRTLATVEKEVLEVSEGTTINGLSKILAKKYQNVPFESGTTYFLINDHASTSNQILADGDHVRVFRLFAGG